MKTIKLLSLIIFVCFLISNSLASRPEWEVVPYEGWFSNANKDVVYRFAFDKYNNAWICAKSTGLIKYNVNFQILSPPNSTDIYLYRDSIFLMSNLFNDLYLIKYNYLSQSLIYTLKDTVNISHSGICVSSERDTVAWVGTRINLERYDGHTHTYFDSINSPMPYNYVKKLAIDKNNIKWIVTVDIWSGNPYNVLKYNDTTWIVYNDTNSILRGATVTGISVDSSNHIWLGTTDGLGKFDSTWHFFTYPDVPLDSITNTVSSVETDREGIVWVGTPGSVLKYQNNTWSKYSNPVAIGTGPTAISKDTNGNIWLACPKQFVIFKSGGISGRIIVLPDTGLAIYDDSLLAVSVVQGGSGNIFSLIAPNPFNKQLKIEFELKQPVNVIIQICDINGVIIKEIYNGMRDAGKQNINYDASDLPQGNYFIIYIINGEKSAQKAIKIE